MKICIDAGHGGKDSGAVFGNLIEKNINLIVAKEVERLLKINEIEVVMTRIDDVYVDLNTRSKISNEKCCDLFISIHHNAGGGDRGEVIYSIKGGKSKELAFAIAEEFKNIGQTPTNTYSKANSTGTDYYAVIRNTKAPAVITEFCFLDNVKDNQIIDIIGEQLLEAKAIAKGICRVIGVNFKEKKEPDWGVLKRGMTGQQVKELQQRLNKFGYKLAVDGSFGQVTEGAVKDFQRNRGLKVDGIVGPQTIKALFN